MGTPTIKAQDQATILIFLEMIWWREYREKTQMGWILVPEAGCY